MGAVNTVLGSTSMAVMVWFNIIPGMDPNRPLLFSITTTETYWLNRYVIWSLFNAKVTASESCWGRGWISPLGHLSEPPISPLPPFFKWQYVLTVLLRVDQFVSVKRRRSRTELETFSLHFFTIPLLGVIDLRYLCA